MGLPSIWVTILLLMAGCNLTFTSNLDIALGVSWSSYEKRGITGNYLSKDFAEQVILPLMNRIAENIMEQKATDKLQNGVILALGLIVGGVGIFTVAWVYARRHFLAKIAKMPVCQFDHEAN